MISLECSVKAVESLEIRTDRQRGSNWRRDATHKCMYCGFITGNAGGRTADNTHSIVIDVVGMQGYEDSDRRDVGYTSPQCWGNYLKLGEF